MRTLHISAVALAIMSGAAMAADLSTGGACCADLEERLAELESTAARKGNRAMSLSVYGQVNQAILWVDSGSDSRTTITDNPNSMTRFGFEGEAAASGNMVVGFRLEIGASAAGVDGHTDYDPGIRHAATFVRIKEFGEIWLGRTSTATDGIVEMSVANVAHASTPLSIEPLASTYFGGDNLEFDGGRGDVIAFKSATFAGFQFSASFLGDGESDTWDVAIRYAGEFGGFRVAAGGGYATGADSYRRISGSISAMHVSSGIFANVAGGKVDNGSIGLLTFDEQTAYWIQSGIERKFIPLGATTLFGEYGQFEGDGMDTNAWGFGVVQSINPAAANLYLGYRRYEDFDTQTVVGGVIVKF